MSRAVRFGIILGSDQECPKRAVFSISRSNYDRSPAATRQSRLPARAGCFLPAP